MTAAASALPPQVAAALADPPPPGLGVVEANGLGYAIRTWGDPDAPPLLLIHGVTSSSRVWWRVGPALAAGLGRRAIAVDQAGHGQTHGWIGHHRLRDNARDLAEFASAAGVAQSELRVVGHSWGGGTAAWFPAIGLEAEVIVLLDPPALSAAAIATMLDDPIEHHYDDVGEAIATLGEQNPTWGYGDVVAKAEALTQFDIGAVRAVLLENGDWDAGLEALSDPAAADACVRIVRGDPAAGGLIPDAALEALARRLGSANVRTIPGGSHSPMRHAPEATTLALLQALQPG